MMMIMTIFIAEHYEFIKDERKEIGKKREEGAKRGGEGKFNDSECEFEQ
jgi:hypothetical protein